MSAEFNGSRTAESFRSDKQEAIPRKSIYRLSIYHRCLLKLKANHVDTVSSEALARTAGVKPTQLRKDLAYFGQFGTRGLGYNVTHLAGIINDVLGTNRLQPVILVGAGNFGSALLRYQGFNKEGFEVLAAFDCDASRPRHPSPPVPVKSIEEMPDFVREARVKMAILTVPAAVAQQVANDLVAAGIQAILNFAPTVLDVPENVVVNNVDLALELEHLSYFIQ
jgi:redox-sensing transcriptional repressor